MLITHNISLARTVKITWKTDLILLVSCVAAHLFDQWVISKQFRMPAMIPTVLGSALAFFIGFNNNQAYARWWEARQIWGSLVNNSRSWARSLLGYTSAEANHERLLHEMQKRMIRRHIGFLYALKAMLRNEPVQEYKKYLSDAEVAPVEQHSNKHNAILGLQTDDLELLYQKGWIDGFKFMEINALLTDFCNDMGKSERIKNTIFPTTYNYFTRLFIWVFSLLITIVVSEETGIWSVLLGFIVGFVFHTTHTIGMSLLNPFESLAAGVPINQITRTIEINLLEMLGETNLPPPVKAINNEYVL
ncbi:MAG: hypothetical protein INR73_01425 [Williamsia sp.]|nr:hypothetical protein [Williamsia sp.]